jgi:hypothetical protein
MSSVPFHAKQHALTRSLIALACFSISMAVLTGSWMPVSVCLAQNGAAKQDEKSPKKKLIKPLTSAEKSRLKDQIRRLLQNSRISKARDAAEKSIQRWEQQKDPKHNDLLAYASWAMAVLAGNSGDEAKCIEHFDRALEAGWSNPFTFEYASLVPRAVRNSDDYRTRVERLRRAFDDDQRQELEARLAGSLDNPLGTLKLPTDAGGGTLDATSLAARPTVVVITRLEQPGFNKMVPALKSATAKFGESLPVVVLFYQYFADDACRRKATVKYVENAAISWPFAIVDRSFVKELNLDFLPATILMDGQGRILFREIGTLESSFLDKVFEVGIAATGARAKTNPPEPKAVTPPAEPTEPAPAEPAAAEPTLTETNKADNEPTPADDAADDPTEEDPADESGDAGGEGEPDAKNDQ